MNLPIFYVFLALCVFALETKAAGPSVTDDEPKRSVRRLPGWDTILDTIETADDSDLEATQSNTSSDDEPPAAVTLSSEPINISSLLKEAQALNIAFTDPTSDSGKRRTQLTTLVKTFPQDLRREFLQKITEAIDPLEPNYKWHLGLVLGNIITKLEELRPSATS